MSIFGSLIVFVSVVAALHRSIPRATPQALNTSLTLVYQNNLNASDDVNHVAALILDPVPQYQAASACAAYGESLLSETTIEAHSEDFLLSLSYEIYAGRASQSYYIEGKTVAVSQNATALDIQPVLSSQNFFPVLCTQSSQASQSPSASVNASSQLMVSSGGNAFVGLRDKKSFRFLGIPYADQPARFEYSQPYSKSGETIQATSYGSQCAQASSGSENCLFLNIYTPYIPKSGSEENLRPVLFWIHGGGFTSGHGDDSDGGNMASRADILFVSFNYRLSTLGFFAVPNTPLKGNYGIGDQIIALDWVIQNIAAFGGDPNRITIVGGSAGAGSVRALLGSPSAIGKYQGAIAISNLGGGVAIGRDGDYSTTYSSYLTIDESYARAGQLVFAAAGCNQTNLDAQITCLKTVDALSLVELPTVARYVVQDGTIINTEQLIVSTNNASTAHVPVMWGIMADDGAAIGTSPPPSSVNDQSEGIQEVLGVTAEIADSIIASGLFPFYDSGNFSLDVFNVSARLATDLDFRCIDQATVYAGVSTGVWDRAYFYQFDRGLGGYDPNHVSSPPITPGYPRGNPNLPYMKVHGAEVAYTFGNIPTSLLRDDNDIYLAQVATSYWGEFIKSGQPNPSEDYLRVRGYTNVLGVVQNAGPWEAVRGSEGPIERLDYPPKSDAFVDVEQCAWLNYTLSYYLDSNRE